MDKLEVLLADLQQNAVHWPLDTLVGNAYSNWMARVNIELHPLRRFLGDSAHGFKLQRKINIAGSKSLKNGCTSTGFTSGTTR